MAKLNDMLEYLKRNHINYQVLDSSEFQSEQNELSIKKSLNNDTAKTIILNTDNKYCMAVIPSNHSLDEKMFSKLVKSKNVRMAKEEELTPIVAETNSISPFGNLYALPVYIDKDLSKENAIVFNAHSEKYIKLNMNDYLRLAKPVVAPISTINNK